MGFSEIIGHRRQLDTLRAALAGGRLHHAYLLVGPEGVGKRTLALALARAIHCAEAPGDYCGRCVDCARIANSNHPDVRVIEPKGDKKEISIRQIREIEKELSYRAFGGKRKIVIIDSATSMNMPAQNALLKTLEEPPQDSMLVLIAASAGGLLPTVRSRCLPLSFAPLRREDAARLLQFKFGAGPQEAKLYAAMSMGSIGAAAKLEQGELMEKRRSWAALLTSLKTGDYRAALKEAEVLAGDREQALEFFTWAQSWYRDLSVHAAAPGLDELVNLDMEEQIGEQAAALGLAGALAAEKRIAGAKAAIQRNLNRRMVLEKFLLGVVRGR